MKFEKTWAATLAALAFYANAQCAWSQWKDALHPSDLEAAAFLFTFGHSEKDDMRPYADGVIRSEKLGYFVYQLDKDHCTFRYQEDEAPYRAAQLSFSKLSDLYTTYIDHTGSVTIRFHGTDGTYCEATGGKNGSDIVWQDGAFQRTELSAPCIERFERRAFNTVEVRRFIDAVAFIQKNYCPPIARRPY